MACSICLRSQLLPGADPGGTWSFFGFDNDCDGILSGTTSTPPTTLTGDDPCIDTTNFDVGCYIFSYVNGEGECAVTQFVTLEVIPRPDAGTGTTIELCVEDSIETNLFSLIGGSPFITGVWSGNGTVSAGYTAGTSDPQDDTFNANTAGVGTYTFTYTVQAISGNSLPVINCQNCNSVSSTITINVVTCPTGCVFDVGESGSITLCNATGCSVDLFTVLGGAPDVGGQWSFIGGPAIVSPSQPVSFAGLPTGNYVFEYGAGAAEPTCDEVSTVTVNLLSQPNAGTNGTLNVCTDFGQVFLITGLGTGYTTGGVWTGPSLPVGTTNLASGILDPAPGDAGTYVYTYTVGNAPGTPCETQCTDTAQVTVVIHNACEAGANNTINICQAGTGSPNSFVLSAATLLGGDAGGTWFVFGLSSACTNQYFGQAVFSINGAGAVSHNGQTIADGVTLSSFTNTGCILLIYTCSATNGQCDESNTLLVNITACAASCNSTVTIQESNCVITFSGGSPTNCPNPVIQVQQFTGGSWVPASGTNNALPYTGVHNVQYRVCVTNCPNCGTLCSNVVTASCPPPACQVSCVFLGYNAGQAQFSWNLTGGSGSVTYFFNHFINDNLSNCSLSTGVDLNICPGSGGSSGTASCTVSQISIGQCIRFVVRDSVDSSCITICYGLIPPMAMALACYESNSLPSGEFVNSIIIDTGSGGQERINAPQFNFSQYETESASPGGFIQFIIDLNQWIAANGLQGVVTLYLTGKVVALRFANVDFIPVSVNVVGIGVVGFSTITDPCTECDPSTAYHQQIANVNPTGELCASSGTFQLMNFITQVNPEIPLTGTFRTQHNGAPASCPGALPSVHYSGTVNVTNGGANHGLVSWTTINFFGGTSGTVFLVYTVTLQNGCIECYVLGILLTESC